MTLLGALAQYSLVQSRIDALLAQDNACAADLTFLLRQSSDLRAAILAAEPQSQTEALQKLACVVNLIQRDTRLQGFDTDIDALLDAAHSACDSATPKDAPAPRTAAKAMSNSQNTVFGGSVADYVAFAEGRVSLVDTEYRFVATSEETARFYGRQQIALMGIPLEDVIGSYRFQLRSKPRLDACFKGEPQTYHAAVPLEGAAAIMRCDMKPVRSGEGGILGALVYMTDVTEQVKRLRQDQNMVVCDLRQSTSTTG